MPEYNIQQTLKRYGQDHIINYIDKLTDDDKKLLYAQINEIDWDFLSCIGRGKSTCGDIKPINALSCDKIAEHADSYMSTGLDAIRAGKLCLLLLAGGQGTRLGYDKPKGSFNIGVTHELYIFQLLIEHTLDVIKEAGTWIHMYIMTSEGNYKDTVDFFNEHNYFGYNPKYIHFFIQEMNPATDFNGKLMLSSKNTLTMSPNGNGGWFKSMHKAGLLDDIYNSSIEWINVFAVDNVLQRIADPVFLGATIEGNKGCGAKVVRKISPDEKVGAICLENGKPHIIEYYELSDDMKSHKNSDGSLSYGWGVILNYLFPIEKLKDTLDSAMPLHVVEKIVPYIDENGKLIKPATPNAYKYETLALDLIHEMDDCLVFEVERDREFAPVKNRSGIDSIDSARILLQKNGYKL